MIAPGVERGSSKGECIKSVVNDPFLSKILSNLARIAQKCAENPFVYDTFYANAYPPAPMLLFGKTSDAL